MAALTSATRTRPAQSALIYSFTFLRNRRAFWLGSLAGIMLLIVFGGLFGAWTFWLRPDMLQALALAENPWALILLLAASGVATILLHELMHGALFWIFTRSRPVFGYRSGYFYASAPGWYFPRLQYLAISLAPLVCLSGLGLVLVLILPVGAVVFVWLGMVINASGAVMDLWTTVVIARQGERIVIEDSREGFSIYGLSESLKTGRNLP